MIVLKPIYATYNSQTILPYNSYFISQIVHDLIVSYNSSLSLSDTVVFSPTIHNNHLMVKQSR